MQCLSLGSLFGAAVSHGGLVHTWGSDEAGALGAGGGAGSGAGTARRSPEPVKGLLSCEAVTCGWKHAVALTGHGALFSWGWGGSTGEGYGTGGAEGSTGGQLGLGDDFDYWAPTQVEWLQVRFRVCMVVLRAWHCVSVDWPPAPPTAAIYPN